MCACHPKIIGNITFEKVHTATIKTSNEMRWWKKNRMNKFSALRQVYNRKKEKGSELSNVQPI